MIDSSKQIRIGAIISYTGIFFSIITGLVYNPWMIKVIGTSDYGLYTLAMSLINTFLIDFGLSVATQRYISKYLANKNQTLVNNIIGLILKLYFFIAIVLCVIFSVLYIYIDDIYIQLTATEINKFKILYILAAVYSITSFPFVTLNGILSSYEKFIALKSFDLLYKLISVGLTVGALLAGKDVYILVVVNLFTNAIITLLKIITINKVTPIKINFKYFDYQKTKELFGFSVWSSVSTMIMRLFLTLGPTILGVVSGSYEIAIFGYAVSLEGYIYTFVNAINGFFLPRLSRLSILDETVSSKKVVDLMVNVGRFILGLYGLIYIGFASLGKEFITLIIGHEYLNAYYCTLLICTYGIVAYPQQIANTYSIVMNKVKKRAQISIFAMAIYLILSFSLAKAYGSIGLCGAICISLCVQTLLLNHMYYKDLRIDINSFFKRCHLKSLPGLLFMLCVAQLIASISIGGWHGFVIKVIMIIACYICMVASFMLTKEEKKAVRNKFYSLKKR